MYLLNTSADQQAMLAAIGVSSIDDLFAPIPSEIRLKRPLNIPPALTEIELTNHFAALANRNQSTADAVCFLGGGAYDHFIPAVVDAVGGRSEYYTAYTPYQAEASQGSLQVFYEYQTLVCQLTGMEVANASLYEGGSAVAEALLMALNIAEEKGEGRNEVILAGSIHPEYRQVTATYLANLNARLIVVPTPNGFLDPDDLQPHLGPRTAAVVFQSPNFFGCLEESAALTESAHKHGALSIVSFDPISVGLLKRPGDYGADIAVGEGQALGCPLGYGGPYLGLMACRTEFVRKMPGRLVGETTDRNGKRCWVLTLQTREQHIRREKATSNICTNQGLFATRAAVHLTALGPQGLKETAELCLRKAHYAAEQACKLPGVSLKFSRPFFKEFTLCVPTNVQSLLVQLREQGYFAGLPTGRWYPELADCLTIAVTEKRTKTEIDGLVGALKYRLGLGTTAVQV